MPTNVEPELADVVRVLTDRDHANLRATLIRIAAPAGRISAIAKHGGAADVATCCEMLRELVVRLEAWSAHIAVTGAPADRLLVTGVLDQLPRLAGLLEQADEHAELMRAERRTKDIAQLADVFAELARVARHALDAIPRPS